MSALSFVRFNATQFDCHIATFVQLLKKTVNDVPSESLGFVPPLRDVEAERYWSGVRQGLLDSTLLLFCALDDGQVVGTVQLHPSTRGNARHRAEVAKLIVAPNHRRQGIGKHLMLEVEREAARRGLTTLVLDTREGNASNAFYLSLGYGVSGRVPQYARDTAGRLHATMFYYKLLEQAQAS